MEDEGSGRMFDSAEVFFFGGLLLFPSSSLSPYFIRGESAFCYSGGIRSTSAKGSSSS